MKRLTVEFVKEKFAERGYTLLSNNYLNAHQKLKFKCNMGHEHREGDLHNVKRAMENGNSANYN